MGPKWLFYGKQGWMFNPDDSIKILRGQEERPPPYAPPPPLSPEEHRSAWSVARQCHNPNSGRYVEPYGRLSFQWIAVMGYSVIFTAGLHLFRTMYNIPQHERGGAWMQAGRATLCRCTLMAGHFCIYIPIALFSASQGALPERKRTKTGVLRIRREYGWWEDCRWAAIAATFIHNGSEYIGQWVQRYGAVADQVASAKKATEKGISAAVPPKWRALGYSVQLTGVAFAAWWCTLFTRRCEWQEWSFLGMWTGMNRMNPRNLKRGVDPDHDPTQKLEQIVEAMDSMDAQDGQPLDVWTGGHWKGGVPVDPADGTELGKSPNAGWVACRLTAWSRVLHASLAFIAAESTLWATKLHHRFCYVHDVQHMNNAKFLRLMPQVTAVYSFWWIVLLPPSLALYPSMAKIPTRRLENKYQEQLSEGKRKRGYANVYRGV